MAKLLFRLNGVSDDEADQIRSLLEQHDIDFYETNAGRWGISLAAIWLRDDESFESARQLILESQQQRQIRLRSEFEEKIRNGDIPPWYQRVMQRPMDFIAVIVAIIGIVALMLWPFLTIFSQLPDRLN